MTASFVYDAFGRRMEKTVGGSTTEYLYDGLNPVQELNGASPPSPTANMLTGLGIDEYFTRTDSSGTMAFLSNALGSTIGLVNSAGTIATGYTYEPFGNTTVSGPNTNPYQFTGRENDNDSLYYYRARYYSPTFQRFIAQDPLHPAGGNLYSYVVNDPTDGRDPFGLYTDYNLSVGGGEGTDFAGLTGGFQCDKCGCHPYFGGGLMTPGGSASIMHSPGNVTPGLQFGIQAGNGLGGQFGFSPDKPNSFFSELGIMTEGGSITGYYVWHWTLPWPWPAPGPGCTCH